MTAHRPVADEHVAALDIEVWPGASRTVRFVGLLDATGTVAADWTAQVDPTPVMVSTGDGDDLVVAVPSEGVLHRPWTLTRAGVDAPVVAGVIVQARPQVTPGDAEVTVTLGDGAEVVVQLVAAGPPGPAGPAGADGPPGVVTAVGELVDYDAGTQTITVDTPTAAQVGADPAGSALVAVSRAGLPGSAGLLPPGLDAWFTDLVAAKASPVDVVMICDSLDIGVDEADPPWSWLLGEALAAASAGNPVQQWVAAKGSGHPGMTTCQGTVNEDAFGGFGANLSNTHSATQVGWCDAVSVMWSAGAGTITVREGSASGTILGTIDTSTGTGHGNIWTSADLGSAHRTIHLRSTGTTTFSGVYMHSGNADVGVRVWGASHSGWGSTHFTAESGRALDLIESIDPALVIIEVATNDTGTTALAALLDAVEALSPGTVVGIVPPESPAISQTEVTAVRDFYTSRSVPVVDIDRALPDYRTALVSDGLHPTPEGRAAFADATALILGGNPIMAAARTGTTRTTAVDIGGLLEPEIRILGSIAAATEGHGLAPRIEMGDAVVHAPSGRLTVDGSLRVDTPGEGFIEFVQEQNQPTILVVSQAGDARPLLGMGGYFGLPVIVMSNATGTNTATLLAGQAPGEISVLSGATPGVIVGGHRRTVNAVTATAYTVVLADQAALVTRSNANASTMTWPSNATAAIPVGTEVPVINLGAGVVTHAAGSGAALATGSTTTQGRGVRLVATKTATNTWLIEAMPEGVTDYSDLTGLPTLGTASAEDVDAFATPTDVAGVDQRIDDLADIATTGSASDLSAGTVPTARLGSGTADSGTVLHGDQVWRAVASGGGGDRPIYTPASSFQRGGWTGLQPLLRGSTANRSLSVQTHQFPDSVESATTAIWAWAAEPVPWPNVDIYIDWANANATGGDVAWIVGFGPTAVGAETNRPTYTALATATAGSTTRGTRQPRALIASSVTASPGNPHSIHVTRAGDSEDDTLAGVADFWQIIIVEAGVTP